jgi:2-dehydro-3-deoxyphosphogluconate aldolase / (4S)-4-hydroxy-2-oxoglutarate aldolase
MVSAGEAGAAAVAAIERTGVVAILRASSEEHLVRVADALLEEGLDCIEVTATTPGAFVTLEHLAARFPQAWLGMGTITDRSLAERALGSGARYLVTPSAERDVIEFAGEHGLPIVAGALTPTEIVAAERWGADIVKVFPVAAVGGVEYIRAIRGPLPDVRLGPTGGVAIDDVEGYLRAGCVCVGLGSPLIGDALAGGSLSALRERARRVVAAVGAARGVAT